MRFFEIDIDEDQLRAIVKIIVDHYEHGLHEHGSYQAALEMTQEATIRKIEDDAAFMEHVEHSSVLH
jgi:hypothetical protein